MVRLDLTADRVGLSAHASGIGASEATVPAKFIGGGDAEIHTAFNPAYVLDALKTLGNNELIIDVQQNGLGCDGTVFSKPALIYARHDPSVRWLLMPISAGLEAHAVQPGFQLPQTKGNPVVKLDTAIDW
jgi:DNA polymerase III sliding clamp (beta) subunit (PCNA family)